MCRAFRLFTIFALLLVVALCGVAAFVAEGSIHIWMKKPAPVSEAGALAQQTGARWETVSVTASGGVRLEGWLFTPARPNGAAVLSLHGVNDCRVSAAWQGAFLLRAGYTVLAPDSRGHGASGGDTIGYGVMERDDVRRWADFLLARPGVTRLYGIGQSMGAAILLQSLPREPRLRAVVADCPFATFDEVAFDRLRQLAGLGHWPAWPIVRLGMFYDRLRYRIDLRQASPVEAMRSVRTPVLLIHGMEDRNIPINHSREIHAANPAISQLWEVPGAGHTQSQGVAPEAYHSRVLAWFNQP
jgi:uncharacterized protein